MKTRNDNDHFCEMLFNENGGTIDNGEGFLYAYGSLIDGVVKVGNLETARAWVSKRMDWYRDNPVQAKRRQEREAVLPR